VRARRISLRISPAKGIELVLPRGASVVRGEALLREKSDWVRRTLERMQRVSPAPDLPPLASGRVLTFAGQPLTVSLRNGAPAGRVRAQRSGDVLHLTLGTLSEETIRAALVAWYRRHAPSIFAERLQLLNRFGFRYGRVSIKEQKSRWGSCSRAGNLNFNWRLLLAPLPVLDYVVVHELAHLKEANHGPRFWALVAGVCPDHRVHRRWLREHGHELRF
jgi:predicted metal-dependent hydrolase